MSGSPSRCAPQTTRSIQGPGSGSAAEAGGRSLEIGRVSALVRLLEQQGIAPERLAAGILPDQPADVQVQIRIYDEPPPQGDFEALVR